MMKCLLENKMHYENGWYQENCILLHYSSATDISCYSDNALHVRILPYYPQTTVTKGLSSLILLDLSSRREMPESPEVSGPQTSVRELERWNKDGRIFISIKEAPTDSNVVCIKEELAGERRHFYLWNLRKSAAFSTAGLTISLFRATS